MNTIPLTDLRKIGFIRKTHGIKGEVILDFEPDFYESISGTNCFFVEISGLPVPFFIAENGLEIRSSDSALMSFDGVDTEKYANRLVGKNVFLIEDDIFELPVPGEDFQFMNFRLFDQNGNELGFVSGADDFMGNIVLKVLSGDKELLISYHPDLLISADIKRKKFSLRLPEGFNELDFT